MTNINDIYYSDAFTHGIRGEYWINLQDANYYGIKHARRISEEVNKLRSVSPAVRQLIIAERCEEYGVDPNGLHLPYIRFKRKEPYWPGEQPQRQYSALEVNYGRGARHMLMVAKTVQAVLTVMLIIVGLVIEFYI